MMESKGPRSAHRRTRPPDRAHVRVQWVRMFTACKLVDGMGSQECAELLIVVDDMLPTGDERSAASKHPVALRECRIEVPDVVQDLPSENHVRAVRTERYRLGNANYGFDGWKDRGEAADRPEADVQAWVGFDRDHALGSRPCEGTRRDPVTCSDVDHHATADPAERSRTAWNSAEARYRSEPTIGSVSR